MDCLDVDQLKVFQQVIRQHAYLGNSSSVKLSYLFKTVLYTLTFQSRRRRTWNSRRLQYNKHHQKLESHLREIMEQTSWRLAS